LRGSTKSDVDRVFVSSDNGDL